MRAKVSDDSDLSDEFQGAQAAYIYGDVAALASGV